MFNYFAENYITVITGLEDLKDIWINLGLNEHLDSLPFSEPLLSGIQESHQNLQRVNSTGIFPTRLLCQMQANSSGA